MIPYLYITSTRHVVQDKKNHPTCKSQAVILIKKQNHTISGWQTCHKDITSHHLPATSA